MTPAGRDAGRAVPAPRDRRSVFISYTHRDPDRGIARGLARALRRLRLPAEVVGPDEPRRLHVFRDRDEGRGGELDEELREAVEEAVVLVAVCSPRAVTSDYVGQEIRWFRSRTDGPEGAAPRIVPVLVAGDPTADPGTRDDPFHAELRAAFEDPWSLDLRPKASWAHRLRDLVGLGSLTGETGAGRLRSVEPDTIRRVAVKVAAAAVDRAPSEVWDPLQPRRRAVAAAVAATAATVVLLAGLGWRSALVEDFREALEEGRPAAALTASRRLRLLAPRMSDSLARAVLSEPVPVRELDVGGPAAGGTFLLGGDGLAWWSGDSIHYATLDDGGPTRVWSAPGTVAPGPGDPEGRGLVYLRGGEEVWRFDAAELRARRIARAARGIDEVAFGAGGGSVLVVENGGRITLWSGGSATDLGPVPHPDFRVESAALSSDGAWIALVVRDRLLVRAEGGWSEHAFEGVGSLDQVLALDGDEAVVSGSGGFAVVTMPGVEASATCPAPGGLLFSRSVTSDVLVVSDGGRVEHRRREAPCRVADAPPGTDHDGRVRQIATGWETVSLTRDERVARIWDMPSGGLLGTLASAEPLVAAALSPARSRALTLDAGGRVRVWELCRYRIHRILGTCGTPPPLPVLLDSLTREPGREAAVADVRARDVATDRAFRLEVREGDDLVWTHTHAWAPWALRFSEDGGELLVLGTDGRVRAFGNSRDSLRAWVDAVTAGG